MTFRYFLPILFGAAGVTSQNKILTLNFANTIISASGAVIGTTLTDRGAVAWINIYSFADSLMPLLVGRRTMWFWGTLACAGTLAIVTG